MSKANPLMLEKRPSEGQNSRPKRVPLSNLSRNILTVEGKEDGFHYCWVNDSFVDRRLQQGYDFVTHEVMVGDRRLSAVASSIRPGGSVISINVGNNTVAYLMRIPQEYYEEDLKYMNSLPDQLEESMHSKATHGGLSGKIENLKYGK